MKKCLIVRFSSLGDIAQCLFCVSAIKSTHRDCEIHWAVRSDFKDVLSAVPDISRIWVLNRQEGLAGLLRMARLLRQEGFTHIYDAHNNLRSHILSWGLKGHFIRRSKSRFQRFLLFKMGYSRLPQPFRGGESFVTPLEPWGVRPSPLPTPKPFHLPALPPEKLGRILLAPSAAWDLKRWPAEYWVRLIELFPAQKFGLLGGPDDHFCQDLASPFGGRVENWAGRLSWIETMAAIQGSPLVVSGDTGVLHMADLLGVPCLALMGPTAFGFPSRETSHFLVKNLKCQPCSKDGRGRCRNSIHKKCLMDITPDEVAAAVRSLGVG